MDICFLFVFKFCLETFSVLWQFSLRCVDERLFIEGCLRWSLSCCPSLGQPLSCLWRTQQQICHQSTENSVNLLHKAVGCLLCTTRVQGVGAQAGVLCPSREAKLCSQDFLDLFCEMVVSVGTYLFSLGSGFKPHYSGALGLCLWLFQNGIILIILEL